MCEQQRLRPGFHRFARFSLLEDQTMQPCGFSVPCQRIARTLNEHMENCEIIDALTTSRMIVASQKVAGSSASYRLLPRTRRRTNMLLQDEQQMQAHPCSREGNTCPALLRCSSTGATIVIARSPTIRTCSTRMSNFTSSMLFEVISARTVHCCAVHAARTLLRFRRHYFDRGMILLKELLPPSTGPFKIASAVSHGRPLALRCTNHKFP
ncbi:uncharacterized protein [Dermacentor albipictus]|uniref:uncharacterized protein isoform X3 n=1 Tax=Dermacentor albipictus TaxID=60249 RepID=UPI0031FBD030